MKVNVLISWLAHAVTLVIGFVLMPFILSQVGDTTYGTWLLLNSVAGQASLLYFGFGEAISRFTSKYHTERKWIQLNRTFSCISSVYFCSALIALIITLILVWIAPRLHDWPGQSLSEVRLAILLLGINAAVSIAGSAFGGVLMGIQRFDIERGIVITITLLRLILTISLLHADYGLVTLAGIFLAVTVIENLATCFFAFKLIPTLQFRWRHLRRSVYRRCFSFSMFTFISLIAEHLVYSIDTLLIGFIMGPALVVPYHIALRICEMIRAPVIQIGFVFMPKAGQLQSGQQTEKLRQLVCRGFGLAGILSASAMVGVFFFSPQFIEAWIGSGYSESSSLLLILLCGQMIALPAQMVRHVLTGIGYVRLPAFFFIAEAICNLLLSLTLIPFLGLYGVAIGTLVPLVVFEGGCLIPIGVRHLGMTLRELFWEGLAPQWLPLTLIIIYSCLVHMCQPQANWIQLGLILSGAILVLAGGLYYVNRKAETAKLQGSAREQVVSA